MPTYAYRCPSCGSEFDKVLPLSRYDEPQDCPDCGHHPVVKSLTTAGFILKGDGWAGKNNKIAGQMRKKNERLASKDGERKRDAGVRLVPNVEGEQVSSWSDAAKLAKDKGVKDTSAYDRLASKEVSK